MASPTSVLMLDGAEELTKGSGWSRRLDEPAVARKINVRAGSRNRPQQQQQQQQLSPLPSPLNGGSTDRSPPPSSFASDTSSSYSPVLAVKAAWSADLPPRPSSTGSAITAEPGALSNNSQSAPPLQPHYQVGDLRPVTLQSSPSLRSSAHLPGVSGRGWFVALLARLDRMGQAKVLPAGVQQRGA